MRRIRVHIITCIMVMIGLVSYTMRAGAEFPDGPVTIVVGMDPGGPFDLVTRAMASTASGYLGHPVMVENKGGGGGTVALGSIMGAKPDGYRLAGAPDDAYTTTALMQKLPFKPLKDFTPIVGFAASVHTAILVKSDAPWKTFKEFVDYAKKNPGKVKYSSPGIGLGMHIAMERIALKEGIKWVHVPYKGVTPARTALLGGHVDALSSSIDWTPYVQSGSLRVLVTCAKARSPHTPDVPTLKELGYDFVNDATYSISGPAGIPLQVVEKLEKAFLKATETEDFKKVRDRLYLSPAGYGSKEFAGHLKERWIATEKTLKEIGLIKEAATQPN
jgi:tripartite-type tricarboxylate transporter receptor subunit TctC